MDSVIGRTHRLSSERVHYRWNAAIPPILEIDPGDEVIVEARIGNDNQYLPGAASHADVLTSDPNRVHPLTGPIFVRGARPGDTLEVVVKDLTTGDWGMTQTGPGKGFVPEHFAEPYLKFYDLTRPDGKIEFAPGILIPRRPFMGIMGVAPAGGERRTWPPGAFGGNLDCKDLTIGSRLFLPVFVEGALFSTGDGHAVQGDGEVCITAVECPMTAHLRFLLHRDRPVPEPQIETDDAFMTTGFGETLEVAAKKALLYMIDYLESHRGLNRYEAYLLCSVAVDLRINQVVNRPMMGVRAVLPKAIFAPAATTSS